jgi:hypothetical protein
MKYNLIKYFLLFRDLEYTEAPVFSIKAHSSIINDIGGCGGSITSSYGPPELATASRDGKLLFYNISLNF